MIDVFSISGEKLFSALITEDAIVHHELMASDYVRLSWSSDKGEELPVGAYVDYEGERYSLHEPYAPERVNEVEYRYKPQFRSRTDAWDKTPVCVYTYEDDGATVKSRQFDWSFVGSPADAMYIVLQAIMVETGDVWTAKISDSLPATIELASQTDSIKSILERIASLCETEYWFDKKNNVIHLSFCEQGGEIPLTIGKDISVPTVTSSGEGYYTRYYPLGSSRNIQQDASEGGSVVNSRLTLNPSVYPEGYKDVKGHFENGVFVSDLLPSEVFSKVVIFDDIYPSSALEIYDVRPRLKYRVKDGEKVVVGGTKEKPIYDQYAIWYFKIRDFEFSEDLIIKGKTLSAHFNSGQLAGNDFELAYHDKASSVFKEGDVVKFEIQQGDYEIQFREESGVILPSLAYIIPSNGDNVTLFNIEMPKEYTEAAWDELEAAIDERISEDSKGDKIYSFTSNPVEFSERNIDVPLGSKLKIIDGPKSFETRVTMIEKQLDFSYVQKIRAGGKVRAGSTKELKEDIKSLNQNVDVLAAFNDLSKSIQEGYARTSAQINEALLKLTDMFYWHDEARTIIGTKHALFSEKTVASGGKADDGSGGGSGSTGGGFVVLEDWLKYDATLPQVLGAVLGVELHNRLTAIENGSVTPDLTPYATITFVEQTINNLIGGAGEAYDTLIEIQRILQDNEGDINTLLTAIENKASKEELASLDKKYAALIEALTKKNSEQDNTLSDHETRIDTLEDKEEMFRWVYNADGTRRIETDYDLASLGTIASGGQAQKGEGGAAGTGTVMAVEVNGEIYDAEDGIVTLPDYPTKDEYDEKMSSLDAKDKAFAEDIAENAQEIEVLKPKVEKNEGDIKDLQVVDKDIKKQIADIRKITDRFSYDSEQDMLLTPSNLASQKTIASGGVGTEGDGEGGGETSGTLDSLLDVEIDFTEEAPTEEDRPMLAYDTTDFIWKNRKTMHRHPQGVASSVWTITHNLNKVPNVKVIDSTGQQVYGMVQIGDNEGNNPMNVVRISFGGAFSGTAYLD